FFHIIPAIQIFALIQTFKIIHMKKFIFLKRAWLRLSLVLVTAVTLMISCAKDGEVGPVGPAGPQGQKGNSYVDFMEAFSSGNIASPMISAAGSKSGPLGDTALWHVDNYPNLMG